MASEDVELVIISLRAADVDAADRVAGTREGACPTCGKAIVLSPTTQQRLALGGAVAYCDVCCRPEQFKLQELPGQVQELRRHFGFPQ